MNRYQQTIADLEHQAEPNIWSILGGAVLFLAAVCAVAFILSI